MDGALGVAQHLLKHREVDRVSDGDAAVGRLRLERRDVLLDGGHPLVTHRGRSDGRAVGGRLAGVVVGVGRVGELELLGQLGRGLGRVAREVERRLDRRLHARVGAWLGLGSGMGLGVG